VANEFKHKDAGTELTRTEDNAVDRHIADGQTANDMLYFDGTYWIRAAPATIAALLMSGNLDAGFNRIVRLAEPVGDDDAATKAYVLGQVSPFDDISISEPTRVSGTNYQNSTKIRHVTVCAVHADVDYTAAYVKASSPADTRVALVGNDLGVGANITQQISFTVPPSYYYRVVTDGTIAEWWEWDEH